MSTDPPPIGGRRPPLQAPTRQRPAGDNPGSEPRPREFCHPYKSVVESRPPVWTDWFVRGYFERYVRAVSCPNSVWARVLTRNSVPVLSAPSGNGVSGMTTLPNWSLGARAMKAGYDDVLGVALQECGDLGELALLARVDGEAVEGEVNGLELALVHVERSRAQTPFGHVFLLGTLFPVLSAPSGNGVSGMTTLPNWSLGARAMKTGVWERGQ